MNDSVTKVYRLMRGEEVVYLYIDVRDDAVTYKLFTTESPKVQQTGGWKHKYHPVRIASIRDSIMDMHILSEYTVEEVGLSMLRKYHGFDGQNAPSDIRFITPEYETLFYIPDGGRIEVISDTQHLIVPCRYCDEYHFFAGNSVMHICQYAEILEKNKAHVRPERLTDDIEGKWTVGKHTLSLQKRSAAFWKFQLTGLDKYLNSTLKSLPFDFIQEARNIILADHGFAYQTMEKE